MIIIIFVIFIGNAILAQLGNVFEGSAVANIGGAVAISSAVAMGFAIA